MTNSQYPDFKPGFKYDNIGNIVGTLVFAKELAKSESKEVYGWEFLINAKGYGSVNVRIPMLMKAQSSLDNYPVSDKPRVRAGLSRLEQFVADSGKTYTNATTFIELSDPTTAQGGDMEDKVAGRIAGEVFDIRPNDNFISLKVVSYPTHKDDKNKRATSGNGKPVDPAIITFEAHDPAIIQQIQKEVQQGSNVEIGYKYLNMNATTYDDYGFTIQGDPIERVEIGKLVVHGQKNAAPNGFGAPGQQQGFGQQQGGFGGQQQGGFGGQQQGGFGNPQQQQGFGQQNNFQQPGQQQQQQQQQQPGYQGGPIGDPNQYQMPNDQIPFTKEYNQNQGGFGVGHQQADQVFGDAHQVPPGSSAHDEAQRVFGQGGQNGGFGFGN